MLVLGSTPKPYSARRTSGRRSDHKHEIRILNVHRFKRSRGYEILQLYAIVVFGGPDSIS